MAERCRYCGKKIVWSEPTTCWVHMSGYNKCASKLTYGKPETLRETEVL